ncbi:hypothetical protein L1887_34408 [Cichorium endivia]|nr:hypothetical protein L1887_34408 [Cichorium endivia]
MIFSCFQAQAGELPVDEGNSFVLRFFSFEFQDSVLFDEIAKELGKRDWDFSLNPCDGNPNWATPGRSEMPVYNNTVVCDCSYPGGVCHVVSIYLKGQDLDGVLPSSLAKLHYIKRMSLENNMFSGTVPAELGKLDIEELYLTGNSLNGSIPAWIHSGDTAHDIDLSYNKFNEETVPAYCRESLNLFRSYAGGNNSLFLQGIIGEQAALEMHWAGVNILKDFEIKNEAGGVDKAVKKEIKNVRVTNRTLEIRFQYAGKGTTAVPNRGSYGPLISAISMESDVNPSIDDKKKIPIVIVAVAGAVSLILIVLGLARLGIYIRDRGTLTDGTLVAVKQLSPTSRQGTREFVNEVGLITSIQHPNVVRLHGCCAESSHLLLVYEYLENNSLAHALFGPDNSDRMLDWPTRQSISIGIAKGLAFLHEESLLRMVHRDIKAENILLDRDLTPKISDFGLAKLFREDRTHMTTLPAGTIGYMAPEYATSGYLTYKADVYSFGVLALEIAAGTQNVNHQPDQTYSCLLERVAYPFSLML